MATMEIIEEAEEARWLELLTKLPPLPPAVPAEQVIDMVKAGFFNGFMSCVLWYPTSPLARREP